MMNKFVVSRHDGYLYVWLGARFVKFDKVQAALLIALLWEWLSENEE